MSISLRRTCLLLGMLLAATGLVAVSCWLGREFRIDEPGVQMVRMSRQVNTRGESIGHFFGLSVYDTRRNKLLWAAPTPGNFQHLVGDHFLVDFRSGRLEAIDIDDALAVPVDERKVRHAQFESFGVDLPGLMPSHTRTVFHAIPGSNRFVVQLRDGPDFFVLPSVPSPPSTLSTAYVFEIESRSIKLLTSWSCQRADLTVMPDGRVLSVAPNGKEIEFRSASDFQIEKRQAFPVGLNDWQDITVRNHLFSHRDQLTGATRVRRLDDFAEVPGLNFPFVRSSQPELPEDQRYHLLSDGSLFRSRRLVVYDTTAQRLAFDSGPARGFRSADVLDGQLRLTSLAFGLTRRCFDLQNGQCVRVERPFLSIVVALPIVLLAALAWLIVWITKFPSSTRLVPLNILLVAGLFMTPLVWRAGRWGFGSGILRPTVEYSLSVVLALFFCLAMVAAFSQWRMLLRCIPFLLGLTALFAFVQYAKLIDIDQAVPNSQAVVNLRIWITCAVLSALILGAVRCLRWGIVSINAPQTAHVERAHIYLLDIFLLTAAVAGALTVFVAQVDLLISPLGAAFVLARSAMFAVVACLGLLALVENDRVYRIATVLSLVVALCGIVDIVVHVSCADRAAELWYRIASDCRYPTFLALAVFAFCSMMRMAGMRLKKLVVLGG